MTQRQAAYVVPIPIIPADALEAALILADVPVIGALESETRNGRQVCTATPSDFRRWAERAKALWGRRVGNG